MPDWSYRTLLRPMMMAMGAERSRRLATTTLRTVSRFPLGLAGIDFLGHMRADQRLRRRAGEIELATPLALGSMIDPCGNALPAFSRFGAGLLEVGPVAAGANDVSPVWRVDLKRRTVASASQEPVVDLETVANNLDRLSPAVPVCVRIADVDAASVRQIVERLQHRAAMFSIEGDDAERERACIAAAVGLRPVLLSIRADSERATDRVEAAMRAGAAGVWIRGDIAESVPCVRSLRAMLPPTAIVAAGGVTEPEDVRQPLESGADIAVIDAGLVLSGPGLPKRCNEALLSSLEESTEPEPLSLDAARRAWLWGLLLGVAMFGGGIMAAVIAATRIVLPYDESLSGMTRSQLERLNPNLLPFMAHDRMSLAGTMISIGIFYAALAWFGIRRGAHWAHVTVIVSATIGFLSFFYFLGFGYFDPFHAFVTAILTQFTLLCLVMQPSPSQPPRGEWRENAAWRRGQWGQLLFILIGAGLAGAGAVISFIGCTEVFVATDLHFLQTTREEVRRTFERVLPLVAHDRASLGGMLLANGVTVWLSAQWGFRAGTRWLWMALALGGNIAFACAVVIHIIVGYGAILHLAPAILGWAAWNVALLLTYDWIARQTEGTASISPGPTPRSDVAS